MEEPRNRVVRVTRFGDPEVLTTRALLCVSKSQIGFSRNPPFAAVWRPARYTGASGAPLVLTVYLPRREPSPKWKEVVEPRPGRFTLHLELHAPDELEPEIVEILAEAWRESA